MQINAPRSFISSIIQLASNALSTARQGICGANVPTGGEESVEMQPPDQGLHTNGIVAIGR